MSDQSAEITVLTPSQILRDWADKIEKNAESDFAGAFVVLPPGIDPITGLFIDPEKDINTFFAVVKSKLEAAIDALNEKQKRGQQNGFR